MCNGLAVLRNDLAKVICRRGGERSKGTVLRRPEAVKGGLNWDMKSV